MYRIYDVYIYLFLFCIHVVVGVDDFFVLCYFSSVTSRSSLLSVVRTFYVHYYVMPETILLFNYIIIYIEFNFHCYISMCGYNSVVSLFYNVCIYIYIYIYYMCVSKCICMSCTYIGKYNFCFLFLFLILL
jgi:hypothetical protein